MLLIILDCVNIPYACPDSSKLIRPRTKAVRLLRERKRKDETEESKDGGEGGGGGGGPLFISLLS